MSLNPRYRCLGQTEITGRNLMHVIRLHPSPSSLALSEEIRWPAIRYPQQRAERVKEQEFRGHRPETP